MREFLFSERAKMEAGSMCHLCVEIESKIANFEGIAARGSPERAPHRYPDRGATGSQSRPASLRYRRLALAEQDNEKADLLRRIADESTDIDRPDWIVLAQIVI
jgi:hypothetical protein